MKYFKYSVTYFVSYWIIKFAYVLIRFPREVHGGELNLI